MSDEIKVQVKSKKTKLLIIIAAVIITLLTIVTMIIVASQKGTAKKVKEQLNLGDKYLSELDYEQAIAAYELAIKIDPKCEEAYIALAEIYIEIGEFDKAKDILDEAEDALGEETEGIEDLQDEIKKIVNITELPFGFDMEQSDDSKPMPTYVPEDSEVDEGDNPVLTSSNTVYVGKIKSMEEAVAGDVVFFGTYEQDNDMTNGKEDIEWYVLERQENRVLLVSKYLLDSVPYNETTMDVTWENCTLRRWLNESFIMESFDEIERNCIEKTVVKNEGNSLYGAKTGNDTEDNVFLLSVDDVTKYFSSDFERGAKATLYAEVRGVWRRGADDLRFTQNSWWWLRSPGNSYATALGVTARGEIVTNMNVSKKVDDAAVRPALWLDTEKYNNFGLNYMVPTRMKSDISETELKYFEYEFNEEGGVTITGFTNDKLEEVYVPQIIQGCYVTKIGESAFKDSTNIKKVVLQEGIIELDSEAFAGCNKIEHIEIPEGVLIIGESVFDKCESLSMITIPDSVQIIGRHAFDCCDGIEEIIIPKGVLQIDLIERFTDDTNLREIKVSEKNLMYSSKQGMLFNKDGSKLLCVPPNIGEEVIVPWGTKTIGYAAFGGGWEIERVILPESLIEIERAAFELTGINEITIPSGVRSIEKEAFSFCDLEKICISESVRYIGSEAFSYCENLREIFVDENNPYYSAEGGLLLNKDKTELLVVGGGIEEVMIPNGILKIGSAAFKGCGNIINFEIPEGIVEIGWNAFSACENLRSIIVPRSVTKIDNTAFDRCDSLVMCVMADSYAEQWAREQGFDVKIISSVVNSIPGGMVTQKPTITPISEDSINE